MERSAAEGEEMNVSAKSARPGMIVWKFPFPITDDIEFEMPTGAQVLSVQVQGTQPCIWVLCDPKAVLETRRFRLAGTGHDIDYPVSYVGSFQLYDGQLVFHLFERV